MSLSAQEIAILEKKASDIRQDIIKMLLEAGSGHSAGSLGMADIFTALYFQILKHNPKNPKWPQRDRLVLSHGHVCPALYATLAHAGYFPVDELKTLRKFGSRLQGHPQRGCLPGLETTSGPLGSGLSQACGMALAGVMDQSPGRVVCLMSDGEQDEGNTWEAVMFAGKNRLHNLIALIDRNNIQIDGFTQEVMPLEPLKEKYEAFGWQVVEIDGHNFVEIIEAFNRTGPTLIIARTTPGKGVDFMENNFEWHGTTPDKEEAKRALKELRSLQGKIEAGHHD
ncbi:MAG: transketolase [Patescibacteria group bacterium]|nr:transketolase [Patescibacteria group bacterium]